MVATSPMVLLSMMGVGGQEAARFGGLEASASSVAVADSSATAAPDNDDTDDDDDDGDSTDDLRRFSMYNFLPKRIVRLHKTWLQNRTRSTRA